MRNVFLLMLCKNLELSRKPAKAGFFIDGRWVKSEEPFWPSLITADLKKKSEESISVGV